MMIVRWCCLSLIFLPRAVSHAVPAKRTSPFSISRRDAVLLVGGGTAAVLSVAAVPSATEAADVTVNDLLASVKGVPTFCIVNKEGAAYMIVKADERMAKGYAFTTFQGALTVLADAQRTAKEKGYAELWEDATITAIPADIAIRLALQKKERFSQKDQSLDTLISIIPSVEDRDDAIALDKKYSDQGRVPLFYYSGLQNDSSIPVFFSKRDLQIEWSRQFPSTPPPKCNVLDLVDCFQYTLRGRTDYLPGPIIFVPMQAALDVAKELKSRGLTPYKVDKMII